MKRLLLFLALVAMAIFAASPAYAQGVLVSGNKGTITQGGNDALVDAGGALKINVGELGGTALSGANVVDTGNTAFRVNCVAGCTSTGGSSLADEGTFTQGTTSFTVAGGFFNSTVTNLLSGQGGAVQLTNTRHMLVNVADALPTGANTIGAVTQASGPWTANVTQVGGAALAEGQALMAASVPVAIASNQSAIPASQSGTWTVQPGNTANTTAWLVTGTGGTFPATQSGTWNVGLSAGTNLVGSVSPNYGCGTTAFNQALVATPTVKTAATVVTTCVQTVTFCNTNATAQTVTLEDNQATPVVAVNAASIPALSCYQYQFGGGKFTTGINTLAGGTGVTQTITGVQ